MKQIFCVQLCPFFIFSILNISFLLSVYTIIYRLNTTFKYSENSKVTLVLTGLLLIVYLIWIHIIKWREKIIEVIEELRNLHKKLNMAHSEKIIDICFWIYITDFILGFAYMHMTIMLSV